MVEVNINDSVINSKDVQAIIDPVWWTGDIYQSHDNYLNSLKGFSDNQRFVYAIQWYQDEVDNGGHEQFFYNSTGIVWEDALKGFSKIGLNRYYSILSEAAKKMGNSVPFDRDARIKRLETLEPDFDNLDAQFYKLDSVQSLQDALVDFIQKNRSDFYFKGVIKKPLNAD